VLSVVNKNSNVAVIDIGSNSIKSLVAARGPQGEIVTVQTHALDARISTGIGQARPRLTEEDMQRGLMAVRQLLAEIVPLAPRRTVLVATSAVRDAANGEEFHERIRTATGHELRILTGGEEAALIGRGLTSDPALADLQDFYVFDLGGGSLECLTFHARRVQQAVSLPLGCVRLTERCVKDPQAPFSDDCRTRITEICQEVLAKSGFRFSLPAGAGAVFAGGTVTTVRAIFAERLGRQITETSPLITVVVLRALLDDTARLPLAVRKKFPGLPAARADVFPSALATALAVADFGGITAFRHSFRNLRYGLAVELLESLPPIPPVPPQPPSVR
jgi:exopolyphosphatase/guanosine-5'-triphosphate,3'-diphosphate pyrophosphatase